MIVQLLRALAEFLGDPVKVSWLCSAFIVTYYFCVGCVHLGTEEGEGRIAEAVSSPQSMKLSYYIYL